MVRNITNNYKLFMNDIISIAKMFKYKSRLQTFLNIIYICENN